MGSTANEAIRTTIARYCHLCDDGRFDEWAQLFELDAVFYVMGLDNRGRAAIQEFIEQGQPPERRGRHVVTSTQIELDDTGDAARAWSDFMFVSQQKAITMIGRYHDVLRLGDDGGWRFAVREIVFLGEGPAITDPPPA